MTIKTVRPKPPTTPTIPIDNQNIHVVGCLDTNADKDVRMVIYARVPWDATSIYFLCRNCKRRHVWAIDKKLREWKDRG